MTNSQQASVRKSNNGVGPSAPRGKETIYQGWAKRYTKKETKGKKQREGTVIPHERGMNKTTRSPKPARND